MEHIAPSSAFMPGSDGDPIGPDPGVDIDIDIVICTYDGADLLDRALDALAVQHPVEGSWRVLVVDNNSTDHTAAVVERHVADGRVPGLWRVVETTQGLTPARSRGVRETTAPWVAFVDDDCMLAPGWVAAAVAFARDHPEGAGFGGRVLPVYEAPDPRLLEGRGWAFAEQDLGPTAVPVDCLVGAGMVVNRQALETSGWVQEPFFADRVGRRLVSGGDVEIALRLAGTGRTLWYVPSCELHHVISASRTGFPYLLRMTRSLGVSAGMASALTWGRSPRGWAKATVKELSVALVPVVRHARHGVEGRDARRDVALAVSYELGHWEGSARVLALLATGRCPWFGRAAVGAPVGGAGSAVSYAMVDVELTASMPGVRLRADQAGIGFVSRRAGRIVGFALHAVAPGTRLDPDDVRALLDPMPVEPEEVDVRAPLDPTPVEPGTVPADGGPTITVAVCTRDRSDLLQTCLDGLLRLDPPPHELLVIDNAPTDDRTRDLVAALGVRYEREPCPGLDVARNRALRSAKGQVVAFVDDDVVVDGHWLTALREVWQAEEGTGAVTGQILPLELETGAQVVFERRGGFRGGNRRIRYEGQDLAGNPIYPYAPGMFGAGANLSVRRDVALALGGFDEALDTGPPLPGGGDIDMMHRVIRSGAALVYEPRAVVFHRHRREADGLRRQYDSWGRSTMAFVVKTYRADPDGRPKLRRFVLWFVRAQLAELLRSARSGDPGARAAAWAELSGGLAGLLGTYGRSVRRARASRAALARPTVAILPWGDVIEDYTDPIGLTIDDFAERQSGGWLFGYAEALRRVGVDTAIICWSRGTKRPVRRMHGPTGATLHLLPTSAAYRRVRRRLRDPYSWDRRSALRPGEGWTLTGNVARLLAPFLTTTPVALAGVLRREGCAAMLVQEYEEGRFDVCLGLGRLLGIPVYATFQGGDHTRTLFEKRLRKRTVPAAAGLVVSSSHELARLVERYGVDPGEVARIPNPFDPATVPRLPRATARAALGIDIASRVVVWHGRVDIAPKGIDVLVEAWAEVRRSCAAPPTLLLLGTGSGAGWLHDRIEEGSLEGVLWRDEYVLDRRVIGTYLSAADLFVLPSRQEGFPVAPVEAMALGLPVVATDAPGVRSVVGEGPGAGGLVVAREDASGLARELRRLIDDEELCRRLGEVAERRVAEHFSLDAVGSQLRALLVER